MGTGMVTQRLHYIHISPIRNEIPSAYKTLKLVVGFFSCPSSFAFIHFDLNCFSVHYIELPQSHAYERMENIFKRTSMKLKYVQCSERNHLTIFQVCKIKRMNKLKKKKQQKIKQL